jgi:peptidoglycan hydrolase-like protein with peptidoglycan-binding domain
VAVLTYFHVSGVLCTKTGNGRSQHWSDRLFPKLFLKTLPLLIGMVGVGVVDTALAVSVAPRVSRQFAKQAVSPSSPLSPFLISQATETLRLDDQGIEVEELQNQLAALGYYDSEITGYFGPLTEEAVIRFQEAQGLEADGIAGPTTRALLEDLVNRANEPSTPTEETTPSPSLTDDLLELNEESSEVRELQQQLSQLGYYNGPISGFYGELTQASVIEFQRDEGLEADGVTGPTTRSRIRERLNQGTPGTTPPANPPTPPGTADPESDGLLRLGESGTPIRQLQSRLKDLGFYTGSITGVFDEATEEAVRRFQRSQGIDDDGIVGPTTQSSLNNPTRPDNVSNGTPPDSGSGDPPSPVTPTPPPFEVGSGRYTVADLQQRLRNRGFYNGSIDGLLTPATQEAIRAAQQSYRVEADDLFDRLQ